MFSSATRSAARHTAPRRRRLTGAAVATGLAGSVVLAGSLGASLSGFTSTITNATNTASSAALAVSETSGAATCLSYDSTANCTTINKYGGTGTPLAPGSSNTTTVTFNNTGSVAVGSATLAPGTCVATTTGATGSTTPTTPNTTAGNLCSVLQVAVFKGATAAGTPYYTGSLAAFTATAAVEPIAVAANQPYTFRVTLPASATTVIQGQQVSQPLTWTFNQ